MPASKQESVGISPKLPAQAIVTALVAMLAYYGIDLDADVSGAIAVLLGTVAGYVAPPGQVR